jgi:hypothetical protein
MNNPITTRWSHLRVTECEMNEVSAFVEEHHYSHSVKGVTPSFCFRVDWDGELIGAAIFGRPAMKETIDKYSEGGRLHLVELRRFCLIDETPDHAEGKVLGIMLRELKKRGVDRVLSYSDPNYGHTGIIYRGTGFRYLGQTSSINVILWQGRKWSTRSVNRYKNHMRKDLGLRSSTHMLRDALERGEAVIKRELGKFIYLKHLTAATTEVEVAS